MTVREEPHWQGASPKKINNLTRARSEPTSDPGKPLVAGSLNGHVDGFNLNNTHVASSQFLPAGQYGLCFDYSVSGLLTQRSLKDRPPLKGATSGST